MSVLLLAAGTAAAAPRSATKICGQIRGGPNASYFSSVSGIRLRSGTTWTVLATDVPCSKATAGSKALFPQWQRAAPGGAIKLPGFTCVKMVDGTFAGSGTSSGGGLCHVGSNPAASVFAADTFAFRMTGGYTIAQIKAFFRLS